VHGIRPNSTIDFYNVFVMVCRQLMQNQMVKFEIDPEGSMDLMDDDGEEARINEEDEAALFATQAKYESKYLSRQRDQYDHLTFANFDAFFVNTEEGRTRREHAGEQKMKTDVVEVVSNLFDDGAIKKIVS
jgi:hypothetical protein